MGDTWWRKHFVPHVWAGQLSARTYQDLWRGKGSSTQPPEIQSPSRRIVGQFSICMDIPYYQGITILGVRFSQALMKSSTLFWAVKPRKVKEEARKVYQTYLCLKQKIDYTHTIELALIWFVVQVLPISQENLRQLVTAILVHVSRSDLQGAHYDLSALVREGVWTSLVLESNAPACSRSDASTTQLVQLNEGSMISSLGNFTSHAKYPVSLRSQWFWNFWGLSGVGLY